VNVKPGRNDPCPCGSGKKYKHCCEGKVAALPRSPSPAEINPLIALYNAGRYAELENRARLLVDRFPDFGFGWKLLGGALQMQGKDALPAFQKTAELMPNEADAHYNLGVVLKSIGQLEGAVASYRRAVKIKPDYAEAYSNLGNVLKELGQLDEAVASYRRALKIKPESAESHNSLGTVLKDLGQLDQAVASYRRALALKPDYAEAYYNLGNIQKGLGQLDDAAASYRSATRFKPDFADAYNNLGSVLNDLGQFDMALVNCRQAVTLKPDFAEAHSNLGYTFKELDQFDKAVDSCRRALALKPDLAEAHNNLGLALAELGQLDSALNCYRTAVTINPNYASAHINLGLLLLLTGQFSDGWKEYWWRIHQQEANKYRDHLLSDNSLSVRSPGMSLPIDLNGMRIALLTDQQGLGDDIFFLRFARILKDRGAWVGYVGEPRIATFLHRVNWFDYVSESFDEANAKADITILVGDLPLELGMATEADIPAPLPLEVLPEKRKEIARRLAPYLKTSKPLIGITWRGGGNKRDHKMVREISIELLAAALKSKQAIFIIVQRNPLDGEISKFEQSIGQPVLDFSDLNDDLEGMLALMDLIDDYIGVDNTNMHLRASVGKTARILVPHLQDFRCMAQGDSSPWFPGFTIYRKASGHDWSKALEQIKNNL
jgi:tetratricopeptide (TPR) repeat protein